MRVLTVALLIVIPISLYASARSNSGGLAERVAELEVQVAAMEEILQYVRVETEEINFLAGPHWIIEGANVHVRSGSGRTRDRCGPDEPDFPNCEILTGLGNLIVGYNERRPDRGDGNLTDIRTGSHNLVVGREHIYSSFGGFVAGRRNKITSQSVSVTGGSNNEASGAGASVSGGHQNLASGVAASVSGGHRNVASGAGASVSGGHQNLASGVAASVSGGDNREAPDDFNWAAGNLFEEN